MIGDGGRRDHLFDPQRGILYITTAFGTIQRFDVASQMMLEPWQVGIDLHGADITTDFEHLYVAEGASGPEFGVVRKVSLDDGSVENITYALDNALGGTFDISIGSHDKALVTFENIYGGWDPLRELDLATDQIAIRPIPGLNDVQSNASLDRSTDRSAIVFASAVAEQTATW
ncbi:MAG: hypothetical protein HY000_10590 [Planctomycetes bacterium]|nr:hypothetical protein [Planctomycetota bacterium]